MGEYRRLNRMLEQLYEQKDLMVIGEAEPEDIAGIDQEIGEVVGALLEMAELDGLDDPYEAFDY